MLLSPSELAGVVQQTELPGKYTDPVLAHDEIAYVDFIVSLFACHLVRFDLEAR